MKKINFKITILCLIAVSLLVLSACRPTPVNPDLPAEPNLLSLLVAGCEREKQQDWTFDQILEHVEAERLYSATGYFTEANRHAWELVIYKRTLNLDNQTVSHTQLMVRWPSFSMQSNANITFISSHGYLVPSNLSNHIIDEVITLVYSHRIDGRLIGTYEINLRVIREPVLVEILELRDWGGGAEIRIGETRWVEVHGYPLNSSFLALDFEIIEVWAGGIIIKGARIETYAQLRGGGVVHLET